MEERAVKPYVRTLVTATYLAMILVNALANILPINGQGTGTVSDAYPNLFAPAGFTFSIWGLIYLLLAGFVLHLWGVLPRKAGHEHADLLEKIGTIFAVSSIANMVWIFAWHYNGIGLSMLLMLVILACLVLINLDTGKEPFTWTQKGLIRLPFSVYFGWITVATIANMTTLLVDAGWNGFGISETVWTVLVLVVGLAIGSVTLFRQKDVAYGLVLIWAYFGILIKHTSENGFDSRHPAVIVAVSVCLTLFVLAELKLILPTLKKKVTSEKESDTSQP